MVLYALLLLLLTSCSQVPISVVTTIPMGENKVAPVPSPAARPLPTLVTNEKPAGYEARGKKFAIAAQGPAAARAAESAFAAGGNIIDAAVAASFAISVERPHSTGLGGGGFLLYFEAKSGKTYAIDFRERAPLKASRDMFLDENRAVIPNKSLNGHHSVAVPGLVAGLVEVHSKFGRLPLAKTITPAIQLAEKGVVVYPKLASALELRQEVLAQYPASKAIFFHPEGRPYKLGETIVQRDLAQTLRAIAKEGSRGFYRGKIAQLVLEEMKRGGGLVEKVDFDSYKVIWRQPVTSTYLGHQLLSMPPPSSGGTHVIQVLNMLEGEDLASYGFLSAKATHLTAASLQIAFADRSKYLGDTDFVKVPLTKLTSKEYARALLASIPGDRARPSKEVAPGALLPKESPETTHFSIIDAEGNAVASTQTINYAFGSGVVVPGTGIVLNDEMDDFAAKNGVPNVFGALGGDANSIAPRKTPLSSMSPTILVKDGKPVLSVGAPGGTRIITCVIETILNYTKYQMPLYESVAAVRVHHQWNPDRLDIDAPGPAPEALQALRSMGYEVKVEEGAVPCITEAVAREGDELHSVADPRDIGLAIAQ